MAHSSGDTVVYSSGVAFRPPSKRYWRINNEWYDLTSFSHPGGKEVLLLARDRFDDCTWVFESHHHNFRRAKLILDKYRVGDARGGAPFTTDASFYTILRQRVDAHLIAVGCNDGGPMFVCHLYFWMTFLCWGIGLLTTIACGGFGAAAFTAVCGTILGGFGHNFVHQPKYRFRSLISLDSIGLSSSTWYRDHNLQHHMYTNTPKDNHFKGTDPFLLADPTVQRNWWQRNVTPFINPLILSFGILGNYAHHTIELCKGNETFHLSKLWWPSQAALLVWRWGFRGVHLFMMLTTITSFWYFSLAMMNHNSRKAHTLSLRKNKSWAEQQVLTCTDWCANWSFVSSSVFLWLNTHTVHHLFPRIDISHHSALQDILRRTCEEFAVDYEDLPITKAYSEMMHCFRFPISLNEEF